MIAARSLSLAALLLAGHASCDGEERSPEGAVRRLVRSVDEGNASEVYNLLAPESQRALIERARIANAQVGGGQRFKPEDLLALGHVPPRYDLGSVKLVRSTGDRATVQLTGKRGAREDLELRKLDGRWRILLPAEKEEPPPSEKPSPDK